MNFLNTKADRVNAPIEARQLLQELLAILRAQYWNYSTNHWQASGSNFYGDHLLYERLYKSLQDEVDTLAEKIVGYFDNDAVNQTRILELTQHWVDKWNKTENLIQRAIESEQDFQKYVKTAYDALKKQDDISLGLDDFLMSIANDHESNLYLLTQVAK